MVNGGFSWRSDLFSHILTVAVAGASSLFDLEGNAGLHSWSRTSLFPTGTAIGFDDFLDAITAKLVGRSATQAGPVHDGLTHPHVPRAIRRRAMASTKSLICSTMTKLGLPRLNAAAGNVASCLQGIWHQDDHPEEPETSFKRARRNHDRRGAPLLKHFPTLIVREQRGFCRSSEK